MKPPICSYCNKQSKLVGGEHLYPHRPDLFSKFFYACDPCDAYVGCHPENKRRGEDGKRPLGRLANYELRRAKNLAHRAFDGLWQERGWNRSKAYRWLASELKISTDECHIGMMDVDSCERVVRVVTNFRRKMDNETH